MLENLACNASYFLNFEHSSFCSEVQAKELQLQLDQIVVKEESPYSLKETGRAGKSKSSKNKAARRSPYPSVSAPTADYPPGAEYSPVPGDHTHHRPGSYDYTAAGTDMTTAAAAMQVQGSYPSIMYPHGTTGAGQEVGVGVGVERYGAFYSPAAAYGHPGFYSDSATMGMYSSYHRAYFDERSAYGATTRGAYEDRYYSKDSTGVYPGYMTPGGSQSQAAAALVAQDSPRDSRETYRATASDSTSGNNTGSGSTTTTGNTQYDCSLQNSQCSRSSSRDTNYNTQASHSSSTPGGAGAPGQSTQTAPSTGSVYPTPYSNRSESSASDVDVTEEYEKRHGGAGARGSLSALTHRGHPPDRSTSAGGGGNSAAYADSLLEAARVAEDKRYKENCRDSLQQTNPSSLTNGNHHHHHESKDSQQQQQQSVIMRRQSHSTSTSQSNSTLTDLTSRSNDQTLTSKLAAMDDSASRTSKALVDNSGSRMNSLASAYSHCNYDAYKQSSYHGLQASRTYPMVPQAGYTSVIVDATQQYHLANGYAH